MNIFIIGAGAMGMLLSAKLSANPITLIARTEEQATLIRRDGLSLTDRDGLTVTASIRCLSAAACAAAISEQQLEQADCVLLTVKQIHMTEELLSLLESVLKEDGIAVCYQNGVGHIETLTKRLGAARAAVAVTTEGALRRGPAAVVHTGSGMTKLGFTRLSHVTEERHAEMNIQAVQQCLNHAGFVASLSNEITSDVWNKLVINSVINPLTAQYGLLNGELLESPFLLRLMRGLYDEAISAASAEGISTAPNLWELLLDVCRNTSRNQSSMLQDMKAGRRTEIEWINGSLIRTAAKHGIQVPIQETVYKAISGSEQSR